jgi:hypothetical protein
LFSSVPPFTPFLRVSKVLAAKSKIFQGWMLSTGLLNADTLAVL